MSESRKYNVKIILFVLFLLSIIISLLSGRFSLNVNNLTHFLGDLVHYLKTGKYTNSTFAIIFGIRFPRIILAIAIGAGLSIAGLIFQQIFKNPIASPDILGVSTGASFGAALAMVLAFQFTFLVQIFSFLFALLAVLLTYTIKKTSKNENILYLVLSGIIVSAFFSALLSAVKYLADPYQQLPSIVFWMMGGLYKANWSNAIFCLISVLVLSSIFHKLSYKISILILDDDLAKTMGVNIALFRNTVLILTSLMVSICISIAGTIGWIALITPHISRLIFRNDNKLYIYTGIIGAISLILLDTIARTITTSEIPVGILTSLIGAPILGYLIIFKKTV